MNVISYINTQMCDDTMHPRRLTRTFTSTTHEHSDGRHGTQSARHHEHATQQNKVHACYSRRERVRTAHKRGQAPSRSRDRRVSRRPSCTAPHAESLRGRQGRGEVEWGEFLQSGREIREECERVQVGCAGPASLRGGGSPRAQRADLGPQIEPDKHDDGEEEEGGCCGRRSGRGPPTS